MRISVVIPTWNEELWLPRLLKSLSIIKDIDEIIVADNASRDRTVSIAKAQGCRVVRGGTPAKARNAGAKASSGDILLFIDADAIVTEDSIHAVKAHFADSGIVAVHFRLSLISPTVVATLCYKMLDWYCAVISSLGLPQGIGSFIAVRRSAFLAARGFREDLTAAEDVDMFRRLHCFGKVKYERGTVVHVSARRFVVENPLVFSAKCLLWAALRIMGFGVSVLPYQWVHYPSTAAFREELGVQSLLDRH